MSNAIAHVDRHTPELVHAVLRGLRQYYRNAGGRALPIGELSWSYRSLEDFECGPTLDEPQPVSVCEPVQWLATPDKRFFDDLTGLPLPDDLVRRARVEEMNFMDRLKVWVIDDRNNCLAKTGKPPIPVRWVETNKGSQEEFEVRSRLVAQETKRLSQGMQASEVFSATPP